MKTYQKTMIRGHHKRIDQVKLAELIKQGKKAKYIAAELGVGYTTALRLIKQTKATA